MRLRRLFAAAPFRELGRETIYDYLNLLAVA
jgi:hypothetical protein